jgi:tight adherence protein C
VTAGLQGALLGLLAASGLVLAVSRAPVFRQPSLDDRLAPYLRDSAQPSRLLLQQRALTPFPTLERIVGPLLGDGIRMIERVLGGAVSARHRLEQSGTGKTLEEFRAEQVVWGGAGLLGGISLTVLMAARGSFRPAPLLLLCLIATVVGVLARDRWLSYEVAQREQRMMAVFPTIAELLALAVAAGEGPVGALERVTKIWVVLCRTPVPVRRSFRRCKGLRRARPCRRWRASSTVWRSQSNGGRR